jgi:hypothetical protein
MGLLSWLFGNNKSRSSPAIAASAKARPPSRKTPSTISKSDAEWRRLNKERLCNAKENNWGLYCNTILDMAEHMKKRGNLKRSITFYLDLCYLDLNGPQNVGSFLRNEYPAFTPSDGQLAPKIVSDLSALARECGISQEKLREQFYKVAEGSRQRLRTPLSTEEAWIILEKELIL